MTGTFYREGEGGREGKKKEEEEERKKGGKEGEKEIENIYL